MSLFKDDYWEKEDRDNYGNLLCHCGYACDNSQLIAGRCPRCNNLIDYEYNQLSIDEARSYGIPVEDPMSFEENSSWGEDEEGEGDYWTGEEDEAYERLLRKYTLSIRESRSNEIPKEDTTSEVSNPSHHSTMPPLAKCKRCGTSARSMLASFCYECGDKLSLLCSHCHHYANPSANFCPQCGQKLPN